MKKPLLLNLIKELVHDSRKRTNMGRFWRKGIFSCLLVAAVAVMGVSVSIYSQQPPLSPALQPVKLASSQFIGRDGLDVERLIELGMSRRADLLAARQRMAIAEGRLVQARLRPNPVLDTEYGSPKFLGGEPEVDFSVGVSQTIELGGKRSRRVALAELELNQVRAEVLALERKIAVEIRTSYINAIAAGRQLDVLEKLIAGDNELVRATEARLKEGDVAPLDVSLVKVEADRLRVQAIQARNELDTQLLQLRTLVGADTLEPLRLAPQPDRPPRFDIGLGALTEMALKERSDLQAARLGEEVGSARINLARANAVPNVAGSLKFTKNRQVIDFPPSLRLPGLPQTDNSLIFGISVELPVFNRNQGEIALATAEKVQATQSREFLEATIKRDVAVAYQKYRAAAEALVVYSTQILPNAESNLQSVRAAYGLGDFSVFEVVNEQRRLAENVTGYNQSLRDYYSALAELETAVGMKLPASGFTPGSQSVLPSEKDVPGQIDREKLLKTIQNFSTPKKVALSGPEIKKEQ